MSEDPKRWSQPFAALLGAYDAQIGFGLPSIGGKDSMSGTFMDIHVPPALISFAVDTCQADKVMSAAFKKAGSTLVYLEMNKDADLMPEFASYRKTMDKVYELIHAGKVLAAEPVGKAEYLWQP